MPEESEIPFGEVRISEPQKITPEIQEQYESLIERHRTKVDSLRDNVGRTNPDYKQTGAYKSYYKALDHSIGLSGGIILIKSILSDSPEVTSNCFVHTATNTEGKIVGFDITSIEKSGDMNRVNGEFIAVGFENKDQKTFEKLILAAMHN